MSTENSEPRSKLDKRNILYLLLFTIANLVGVYLVTNETNWIMYLFLGLIMLFGLVAFMTDSFDFIGEYFEKIFEDKIEILSFALIFLVLFLASYLDKFFPSSGKGFKDSLHDTIPLISLAFALVSIVLILKRDFKYKRTVKEKEADLKSQIEQVQNLTDNINKINDRLIKYNPLYSTEATFKNAIDHLQDVSVADVALDFSIESLKQIGKLGFLKIDVSFGDYTQKLFDIVWKSKSSVLGSFTFRPKLIYDEIQSNSDAENNSNLKYLKLLNEKTYTNKIRLVILSKDEIKEILNDALVSMSNTENATLSEIPEVNWFKEQASKGFKVFWTSKNMFYNQFVAHEQEEIKKLISLPDNTVTDFAIFDGDLLITWRKSVENKSDMAEYGTLLISWNRSITKFHKEMSIDDSHQSAKHLYTDFMALVNRIKIEDSNIKDLVDKIKVMKRDGYKWVNDYLPIT